MWKYLRKLAYEFRWSITVVLTFTAVSEACGALQPYLIGRITNAVIQRSGTEITTWLLIELAVILITTRILGYWQEQYELKRFDFWPRRMVRNQTLSLLYAWSIGQHRDHNSATVQSVAESGENHLANLLYMLTNDVVPLIIAIGFGLFGLTYVHWSLGAIATLAVALFLLVAYFMNRRFVPQLKLHTDQRHSLNKRHTEILRNLPLVIVNDQQEAVNRQLFERHDAWISNAQKLWKQIVFWRHLRGMIPVVTILAVIAVSIRLNETSPGMIVAAVMWLGQVIGRLNMVENLHRQFMEIRAGLTTYAELMDEPPRLSTVTGNCPVTDGAIIFSNVSFRYNASDESKKKSDSGVENICLSINAGERVALVGPSGSGKTTTIRLLLREYDPDTGAIEIDGMPLTESASSFRRQIGLVEQDVAVFDDTLRQNLVFGLNGHAKDITDNDLRHALEQVQLESLFSRLSKGFDTEIGERGVRLSGGERQRLAIARALLKNPRILIFDEATSHLDGRNEALIKSAIDAAAHGRTTLIIAHRLSTVKDADRIVVMDQGKIVAIGTHHELYNECGLYHELVSHQQW